MSTSEIVEPFVDADPAHPMTPARIAAGEHVRQALAVVASCGGDALTPEDWHLMHALCRAGRVVAMVREGIPLASLILKEESREW